MLGDLLEHPSPPAPALPCALPGLATVATPGGVVVPRTPPLASVAEGEVTVPPGVDLTPPVVRDLQAVAALAATEHEEAKGA